MDSTVSFNDLLKRFPNARVPIPTPRDKLAGGKPPVASPREILANYRDVIPLAVLERLSAPEPYGDRSKVLWRLILSLLESGLAAGEVLVVVEGTVWNKFGRDRSRLWRDINKAVGQLQVTNGRSTNGRAPDREVADPVIRASRFLARDLTEPRWMVNELWSYQSHGFIAGEPKVRKSYLALDIAISVASGTPALGYFEVPKPVPVLYVQKEMTDAEMWSRMTRMYAAKGLRNEHHGSLNMTFSRDYPLHLVNRWKTDLSKEESFHEIAEWVQKYEIGLLILDPLQLMLGSINENSSSEIRSALQNLLDLKEATKCGVMVVHHYHKTSFNNPRYGGQRMAGSFALHGWVESALYLSKPQKEEYKTIVEREFRNFEPLPNFDIEYMGGAEGYAVTVTPDEPKEKPQALAKFEHVVINDHPAGVPLTDLAKELGMDKRTLAKLIDESLRVKREHADSGMKGGRPHWIVLPVRDK